MPTYDYVCPKCDKTFELFRPISQRNDKHPECSDSCEMTLQISAPKVVYDSWSLTGKKPDDGFRDKLKEIKKNHPQSRFDTI